MKHEKNLLAHMKSAHQEYKLKTEKYLLALVKKAAKSQADQLASKTAGGTAREFGLEDFR